MKRVALLIAAVGLAIPLAALANDTKPTRAAQDAAEHRETEALNRLQAAGYHDFGAVTPAGTDYRTTVTKNGQQASVLVDPEKGVITPAR
ncbi:MAG TPA: hypothetical protein VN802_23800 [Stellaceae bacterium]|nr:hypothetical protein [Stellaceae bacterium]